MRRDEVYLTNLERAVKAWLDGKGVAYTPQYPLRQRYIPDFAILDKNTIIEVDGEYWHLGKKNQKKDRFRDYQLRRAGWKIIRIPERDMDKLDILLSSIM